MNNIDTSNFINALINTNSRHAVEKNHINSEIEKLKKNVFYFYENKTFNCKGNKGKAVVNGKLLMFTSLQSNEIESSYFPSNSKAILAALKLCE